MSMEARVKSVLSGDTLILQNKAKQERTLSLAFINAPRLQSDEPCSFESRDFIRKLCVGKPIRFSVLYSVPQKTGGSSREYGTVQLANGQQLPDAIVQEGWAKLRDDAERKAESPQASDLLGKMQTLEAHAKAEEKGVWQARPTTIVNAREIPDVKAFAEERKGQAVDTIVERVLSGDRLICRLMVTPQQHVQTTVLLAGLRAPATARTNPSDGTSQPAEPYGNEAQAFVEDRLLQRAVTTRILGVSPNNILVGEVRHPMGNIGEFLLKEGLARCVDHHSTWLGSEMGKLRQAEREAREKQKGVFLSHVTQRSAASEAEAVVSRVFSADTLYVRNKAGTEKRINLSSVRGPKASDPKQSAYGPEAKEFLRRSLIGKRVKVTIDGKRPATEGYDEREMATVSHNDKNVALMLVEQGYASVIRHRLDDNDRSPLYDELLLAEEAAQKEARGMYSPKPPKQQTYVDYSESLEKAKRQLTMFSRQKKVPAVVDFVKSGSRFTVLVPRENAKLTFVLGGIRAPRSARGPTDTAEPFGNEAHEFAVKRCMQRDVEIDVDDNDKQGGFIGTLYVNRENFARLLVEEGLASVHAYSAEKSGNANELFAAEQKAKEARRGLWHDWDPSQEAAENGDHDDGVPGINGTNGVNGSAPPPPRAIDYKDVTVTYVDPTNARVKLQIIGAEKANLQSLMRDFASFHLSSSNNQPLPNPPKAGDIVSAKFTQDGVWYRARIRRNDRENKTAEIVYIDYGNSETQPWSALRALDSTRFGTQKLRAQAVDAALSFLQFPTSPEYLQESCNMLAEITYDRELVANIDYTDARENGLLWVTLMEPGAEKMSNSLNAEVVSEGLAMVPKKLRPFEKAAPGVVQDLKAREAEAKSLRRGMWEYESAIMPSYVAIPATPSDIPDIATLMFKANASDLAFSAIYPKGNTPKTLMHFVAQLEEVMDEDLSAYMMIVKDASSGKCVGYAIWHFMTRGGIRGSSDVGKEFFPVEANVDLGVRLVSAGAKKRTEVLQELLAGREDDGYAYLSSIGIDPLHQRQGAAAKMLDWGIDRADDKALPIYVESTPAAIKLYSNFNFRPYDKLTIDLKPINEETIEHICMIRLPNST